MKMFPILILTFVLGLLGLGLASADSPLVAPGGVDPQAQTDLSNASFEEAPIQIAGVRRRPVVAMVSCCHSGGSCENNVLPARCTIQGGTPKAPNLSCTETPPTSDPVACP